MTALLLYSIFFFLRLKTALVVSGVRCLSLSPWSREICIRIWEVTVICKRFQYQSLLKNKQYKLIGLTCLETISRKRLIPSAVPPPSSLHREVRWGRSWAGGQLHVCSQHSFSQHHLWQMWTCSCWGLAGSSDPAVFINLGSVSSKCSYAAEDVLFWHGVSLQVREVCQALRVQAWVQP